VAKSTKVLPTVLGVAVGLLLIAQLVLGLSMFTREFFGDNFARVQKAHLIVGNTCIILAIVYVAQSIPIVWQVASPSHRAVCLFLGVAASLLLILQFATGLHGIATSRLLFTSHLVNGNLAIIVSVIYVGASLPKIWSA
jgi:hypothetical protein